MKRNCWFTTADFGWFRFTLLFVRPFLRRPFMTSHLLKAIVICLFCCISASFALSEIEQTALNKILEVWPNLKNPALFQPAWSSNPSNACDKDPWSGITCDVQGNVIGLYGKLAYFFWFCSFFFCPPFLLTILYQPKINFRTFENKLLNGYIPNAIKDLENLSFLFVVVCTVCSLIFSYQTFCNQPI